MVTEHFVLVTNDKL